MVIGITRKIDTLGRITLPKELRNFFKMNDGDYVEIVATQGGILIKLPGCEVHRKQVKGPFNDDEDETADWKID